MRARRSAGRRELALWLQREQAVGRHMPGVPGAPQVAVDRDRSAKGVSSTVSAFKEFMNVPADFILFGGRQGRNKINSSIFKIKVILRKITKGKPPRDLSSYQEVLNSDTETVLQEEIIQRRE